jgi:hypothetical protein
MIPMKKTLKKTKRNGIPLDFKGLSFEEVISDLLKIKPEPKSKTKSKRK